MSKLKKRQHYVWRAYLQAWADDDKIWTYFKTLNKIEQPNLMGVVQERYFYELVDITLDEEIGLKKFIENMVHASVKDLCFDFIAIFALHSKLKKISSPANLDDKKRRESEALLREIEVNTMENAHGFFENAGANFIKCRSIDDLRIFLDIEDIFFNTMIFLCFQYFRTKKMKNNILRDMKSTEFSLMKFWNIISFCMAIQLAKSLALDPRTKFILFKNSDNDFLTCDQPAFNIKADQLNDNGKVTEFELFYPLSCDTAILIQFEENTLNRYTEIYANPELVKYLNRKVIEVSESFIFANTEQQLSELIIN